MTIKIINTVSLSMFITIKMLILSFEEFINKFDIDNEDMSNIKLEDMGRHISLTPIEIKMRDQTPDSVEETKFNIFVNIHPTDVTHWVLVIRRKGAPMFYFDDFGVETPHLF